MAQDLTLVTAAPPTEEDVRRACAGVLLHGRGLEVDGSFVPDPELADQGLAVGVIAVGPVGGAPHWSLYTPTAAGASRVAAVSTAIGLAAPADAEGRTWITDTVLPAEAGDDEIQAVLAAAAALAGPLSGYVLVNGEHVALEGLADPAAGAAPEPGPRPPLERLSLFCAARLDLGELSGDEGWRTLMRHLGGFLNLTGDVDLRRRLAPSHLWTETEEWIPLDPKGPAPAWWPSSQQLGRTAPRARWQVDAAMGPAESYSGFTVGAAVPAADGVRLLADLESLVPHHLQYGLVHLWTPTEPSNRAFRGPSADSYDPEILLGDHTLRDFLPNLYWAQVFGPPWVELFGADALASVPAFRSEQLAEGVWVVQLTESLADVAADYAAFDALRERCKEHLGADCFFSPEKGSFGPYRAPALPTLAERGLVPPAPSVEEFLGTHGGSRR